MVGSEVRPQLTDLQKSYLVGRELKRSLGGVACHTYLEFDGADVDGARLRRAWKRLTARHAMTRARVDKDGDLRIGSDAGNNTFWLIDARVARRLQEELLAPHHGPFARSGLRARARAATRWTFEDVLRCRPRALRR